MKSKVLFSLLGVTAMLFAGCSKNGPIPTGGGVTLNLKLTEEAVTSTTYTVKVEASDETVSYLCVCIPTLMAEGLTDDDKLIEKIMADVRKQAEAKGEELATYIASIAHTGSQSLTIDGLLPATDYTVVAFGVSGENTAKNAEDRNFTTHIVDKVDCTFDVGVTVSHITATFDVAPSIKDIDWYFCTMTQELYDRVQTENEYSVEQMYISYFLEEADYMISTGLSPDEVLEKLLHKGDLELKASNLVAETKYVYMAGAIKQAGEELVLVSDITSGDYTTEKALPSDMTFELSATEIGKMSAHITITPSNNTEKYIYAIRTLDAVSEKLSAEQLMKDVIKGYPGPTINFALVSGVKDHAQYSVIAGVKYYLLAFGYTGGPTTDPHIKYFTTLPGGNPKDTTFDITITDGSVTPNSASITFTPSDETVYYAIALFDKTEIENDILTKEVEDGLKTNREQQKKFDPNVTMADILHMAYFRGKTPDFNFTKLTPSTTYICTVVTFNLDGTVAKIDSRKNFLTTPALSNVAVTKTEILGYFDGNDEGGQLFGQPEATKDKALVVMKYTPSATAKALYAYTQTYYVNKDDNGEIVYDPMKPADEPDANIYYSIGSNWQQVNIKSPYQFIIVDWDSEKINFSHATDANNSYGTIKRTYIAKAEKGNVGTFEELKAIYDQANAASKAQSASVKPAVYKRSAATGSLGSYIVTKNRDLTTNMFYNMSTALSGMDRKSMQSLEADYTYKLGTDYYLPLARSFKRQ